MKILFATDGSPCSIHAMREAARLLPLADADVSVVAVADVVPLASPYEMSGAAATLRLERELETARKDLESALGFMRALGIKAHGIERHGEPASEILAVADELDPDMIVVGSHGRNALERLLMGSVASYVMNNAACPVMVVKMPKADKA